jgi:hypothetical protein
MAQEAFLRIRDIILGFPVHLGCGKGGLLGIGLENMGQSAPSQEGSDLRLEREYLLGGCGHGKHRMAVPELETYSRQAVVSTISWQ